MKHKQVMSLRRRTWIKCACFASLLAILVYISLISTYVSRSMAILEALDQWNHHPRSGDRNIFFTETTCWSGGGGWFHRGLNPRQACAVESAARANPSHVVYLLHTCFSDKYHSTQAAPFFSYPNVKVMFLDVDRLVENTLVEEWWRSGPMWQSVWPVAHASDLVRFLLLFKYGGVYADLDVIFLRNLTGLDNFIAIETRLSLASAVLGLQAQGDGHALAEECLREYKEGFMGDEWVRQGPDVLRRVLFKRCNVSEVPELQPGCLGDISLQPSTVFNPIHYSNVKRLFESTEANSSLLYALTRPDSETRAVHMWNDVSYKMTVRTSSGQLYSRLAAMFCPRVYKNAGELF